MSAAVILALLVPAGQAEATVCYGGGEVGGLALVPLVTAFASVPVFAAEQKRASLAGGPSTSSFVSPSAELQRGAGMRGDALGEWGRHGYRATSFFWFHSDRCASAQLADLAGSYTYRLVDGDRAILRAEAGVHATRRGLGPTVGVGFEGKPASFFRIGARLRYLPEVPVFWGDRSPVRHMSRADLRLQWDTGRLVQPYLAAVAGNTGTGVPIDRQTTRPWVYVEGLLGIELRSR